MNKTYLLNAAIVLNATGVKYNAVAIAITFAEIKKHQHHFTETPEGVLMHDIVTYIIPFGFLGDLMHPLVKKKLNVIFDYRTEQIKKRFGLKT